MSLKKDKPYAICVVTPIMRRAQALITSKETVFLDSTASCDTTQASVTIMLIASKAGAIPIAVLIHEDQTINGYKFAFDLLKDHHPKCFGGETVTQPANSFRRIGLIVNDFRCRLYL